MVVTASLYTAVNTIFLREEPEFSNSNPSQIGCRNIFPVQYGDEYHSILKYAS